MKLYVYDHCPFCTRARMAFGLKRVPFSLEFVPNDDEATPIRMIGVKMLPILEDADGFMGESLDIVHKIDGLGGPRLFDGVPDPALAAWLRRWGGTITALTIPRTPYPMFPEFCTDSARAYFTAKKGSSSGGFAALLARTDELIAELGTGLAELAPIIPDAQNPSIDDIMLFPWLRYLTIVPGLAPPEAIAVYEAGMAERSGVPLRHS